MALPIENYLFIATPFVASVVFAILMACRNRTWFPHLWWTFFIGAGALTGICAGLYFLSPSTRLPSHSSPAVGPGGGDLLAGLVVLALEVFILLPAFPVLIITSLLPPRLTSIPRRVVILGLAIAWVAALGLSIHAKNAAYLANFDKESNERARKRQEEFEEYERNKPVPPDPEKGPQNEREWRFIGATPTYNKVNNKLESLNWNGGGIGRPFPHEAIESLKFVGSLKSLTLEGITDRDLLNVNRLKYLERLVLEFTKVTDAGLRKIKSVRGLRSIYINYALITDESLVTFLEFPELRSVEIIETKISLEGIKEFKSQHAYVKFTRYRERGFRIVFTR
jgi:hypothetical protein